ncbi:hypothetical protein HQ865_06410 [Mucilaginibacter mali]|uniref:Uncharacterized protein n=1 Tax=Mucilaginibacter mali TaxID=2740462 RepID=A0A7D4PT55_9SPHI|nr:hypothetical protein [Mucilaginibacter mali]QKJ29403.1 hypothetical protein HQ865_06410 [Mucilaginibacter mali]
MIRKIIFVTYQPITKVFIKNFFLTELIDNGGFEIEYWDLSEVFFPGILTAEFDCPYVIKINSLNGVEAEIKKQSTESTLFMIIITYEARVMQLFKLLTKYKCFTAFFARGAVPMPHLAFSTNALISKIRKLFNARLLYLFLINKIALAYKKYGLVKPYDIIFNSGKLGIYTVGVGSQIDNDKSKLININSFDYERYHQTRNSTRVTHSKYAVFLDDYLPHHPDFSILGIKTVTVDTYYKQLNALFKFIEERYDLKVIIAAHPKADNYKKENPFQGRGVYFDQTAELTRHCEFAISHCSTSLNFAVLNEKPIIFIYNDEIKNTMPHFYQTINYCAQTLDSSLVNFTVINKNLAALKEINILKYFDYKYQYLTSRESENTLSFDIVNNTISKI